MDSSRDRARRDARTRERLFTGRADPGRRSRTWVSCWFVFDFAMIDVMLNLDGGARFLAVVLEEEARQAAGGPCSCPCGWR